MFLATSSKVLALTAISQLAFVAAAPALVTVVANPFAIASDLTGPVSASIGGVDSAGHTTYLYAEPVLEGLSGSASSTIGSVTQTLVEGTDYLSYGLSASVPGLDIAVSFDGALSGDNFIVSGTDSAGAATTTTVSNVGFMTLDVPALPAATASAPAPTQSHKSAAARVYPALGVGMAVMGVFAGACALV